MRRAILLFWLGMLGTGITAQTSGEQLPLKQALLEIEQTWQAKCIYSFDWMGELKVQKATDASSFHEAITDICHQLGLHYEFIRPRVVMLREENDAHSGEITQEINIILKVLGDNHEGLPFAFIHEPNSTNTWVSDEQGQVTLKCPRGSCLEVSYLGYEKATICFEHDSQREVQLIPHSYLMPEIALGAEKSIKLRESMAWKGQALHSPYLNKSGGQIGWSDPLRGLQFLPGISNFDDYSANVQIRGGDYDENMIILDDLPLYDVEHYFGLTSNISGELARELTLYKEAVPPEYGGRTSGVIDISSDNKSNFFTGDVYLSNLLGSVRMDIPMSHALEATFAVRSSFVNLAKSDLFTADRQAGPGQIFISERTSGDQTELDTQADPNSDFQDYYGSIEWKLSKTGQIRLNGFFSRDSYSNSARHSRFFPRIEQEVDLMRLEDKEDWTNQAFGLRWDQSWGNSWQQKSLLNYSSYQYDLRKMFFVRNPVSGSLINGDRYNNNSQVNGWKMSHLWQYKINKTSQIELGSETLLENSEFNAASGDSLDRLIAVDALTQALFASWHSVIGSLDYSLGLRTSYYELTNNWYFSPRVLLRYQFNENIFLQTTWSIQQQFLREVFFETPTGRSINYFAMSNDRRIPVLEASQFTLSTGFSWRSIAIEINAYTKNYNGITEQLAAIIGSNDSGGGTFFRSAPLILLEGQGHNRGIEWSSNAYFGKWKLLSAYTLSKNTVSYSRFQNGNDIAAPNDRRHQWNMQTTYRPNDHWIFSAEWSYASGRPYTDVSQVNNGPRDRRNDLVLRNARLSAYQRLDLSIAYVWTSPSVNWELKAQLFNALDRNNQFYEEYFYSFRNVGEEGLPRNFNIGYEQELLGITPSVSIRLQWP